MLPRQALSTPLSMARSFAVPPITGPRQSGKTTLARLAFPQPAAAGPEAAPPLLVYGGEASFDQADHRVLSWRELGVAA